MKRLIISAIFSAACLIIAGCGGGGGGGAAVPVAASATAKTTLKTSGLVAPGYVVTSLDIVITFPNGITVELDPVSKQPSNNVVQLIGIVDPAMVMSALDYTPATSSSSGSLRVVYINAAGFNPSDSLLVQLDITTGFYPKSADFTLTKFDITTMSTDGSNKTSATPVPNPVFTATVI